jgi:predicted acyl esterase
MKMERIAAVSSYEVVIEKDVDVPMRDGARLKADVFRPDDGGNELGDRQSAMVGPQGLRDRPRRWPRQRKIAWPGRSMVAAGGD